MPEQVENGPVSFNMNPYTGPWTKDEAGHLLRKTVFGATNAQILQAVSDGMSTTLTNLLQIPVISEPVAYDPDESIAAFGTSWVNSVYPTDPTQAQLTDVARLKSLAAWLMQRLNDSQVTIAEKMCLFWQNHFSAEATFDQRATYNYFMLLRQHALGNFKQMVKDVTIDPCMLLFLNGASNNVYSPNENYARELLELFTIGKGPQIGSGDYSNYTEDDVAAGAKILTGYLVDGLRSDTLTSPSAVFTSILHDTSTKQLSYHFGGQTVADAGAMEYSNYIDIIFQQDEVANFICRKLYRYFVNYELTSAVETNVIPIMAQTMISNGYNILPVLQQLFSSEHFYDVSLRGTLIKSPLDMLFSMFNCTSSVPNYDLASTSDMYLNFYWLGENLGQAYASPPSVAGWPAYYQAPNYSKLWVSSTTLKNRFGIGLIFTAYTGITVNSNTFKINVLDFVDNLSAPSSAIQVIEDVCDVFFPKEISAGQKLFLKSVLTGGLPDTEWTILYSQYLNNPGNTTYSDPVKQQVELVLSQVFQMPEFQTI